MSSKWENNEPAPLDFFHEELMREFHEYRESKTESVYVVMTGMDFNDIVVKAKNATYEKYPNHILPKDAILKDLFDKKP